MALKDETWIATMGFVQAFVGDDFECVAGEVAEAGSCDLGIEGSKLSQTGVDLWLCPIEVGIPTLFLRGGL